MEKNEVDEKARMPAKLLGIPIFEVNRLSEDTAEIVFMSWEEWKRLKDLRKTDEPEAS